MSFDRPPYFPGDDASIVPRRSYPDARRCRWCIVRGERDVSKVERHHNGRMHLHCPRCDVPEPIERPALPPAPTTE